MKLGWLCAASFLPVIPYHFGGKGVAPLTDFQAISLIISFGSLIILILSYIDKTKK